VIFSDDPSDQPFEPGQSVRVIRGVFLGREGEIKQVLEDKEAVKVELHVFGRPVGVDLEYREIERV
jgi:transcriptional antiterminator NusG